jgi:Flp pilus assembly protein TadG
MALRSQFQSNDSGNMMVMFALTLVPIIFASGMAVDYSRASSARVEMQAAVDSAALAAAHRASQLSDQELNDYANQYFMANFNDPSVKIQSFEARKEEDSVFASGTGTIPTSLALGIESLPVEAEARVGWNSPDREIEVALVLDNTGSMGSFGRLEELKKAATHFVNTLEDVSENVKSVKISIVPFNNRVKVGTSNSGASWLDFSGVSSSQWNGCVNERGRPYNTNDAAYRPGNRDTLHYAENCGSENLHEVVRLTDEFGTLRGVIEDMQAQGTTNITLGAMWGLSTLSETGVFGDGAPASRKGVEKYMILLTDGDNTEGRFHPYREPNPAMDPETAAACNTVKNAEIRLYTIRLMQGNETLLRNCASGNDSYYNVENAANLTKAFDDIVKKIGNIRLTS